MKLNDKHRYTSDEVAAILKIQPTRARHICKRWGIPYTVDTSTTGQGRKAYFSAEAVRLISQAMTLDPNKDALIFREKPVQKKDHPLITDPRCFDASWWPDTVPECFKNMEDDENIL